jgi:hypothetical protein
VPQTGTQREPQNFLKSENYWPEPELGQNDRPLLQPRLKTLSSIMTSITSITSTNSIPGRIDLTSFTLATWRQWRLWSRKRHLHIVGTLRGGNTRNVNQFASSPWFRFPLRIAELLSFTLKFLQNLECCDPLREKATDKSKTPALLWRSTDLKLQRC